jgi:cytochrome b6-f complex iron-sulfur subunit
MSQTDRPSVAGKPTGRSSSEPSRRTFLDWFLGTSAGALLAMVLYPVARFVTPPEVVEAATRQVDAGSTTDPELLDKGYKIVRFGAEPVILVRVGEGDFRAFSATCTHLDCIVEYHQDKSRIYCNCHGGEYDLSGRNVAGPPPRPLTAYQVNVVDAGSGRPPTLVVTKV